MGQLTALAPNTRVVETKGGPLTVRGLAFEDFWTIANSHGPEASMLFAKLVNKEKVEVGEIKVILGSILPQSPKMVAKVIALACDEDTEEGRKVASRLEPRVQLETLEAIFALTIESEAELKKFMGVILRMLGGATTLFQQMKLPLSEAGFGDSARQ
jgi:hypothetical protein